MKVPVSMTFLLVCICLGHAQKMACELVSKEGRIPQAERERRAFWAEGTACVRTWKQEVHSLCEVHGEAPFLLEVHIGSYFRRKGKKHGICLKCKDKGSGFNSVGNGDPVKVFELGSDLGKGVLELYKSSDVI